ncbi:MAG: DUF4175 family protein [Deltaproteobacteria bacterium]
MSHSEGDALSGALERLIKERRGFVLQRGGARFFTALFAAFTIASALALASDNGFYYAAIKISLAVASAFAFARFLLPALTRRETLADAALTLSRIHPALGQDALNALLLRDDLSNRVSIGASKPLIEAHVADVNQRLSRLDLSPAVGAQPPGTYLKPLAIASVLSMGAFLISPAEFQRFALSLNFLPPAQPAALLLADIALGYSYPSYASLPARKIESSSGDVEALKGARVIFRARPVGDIGAGARLSIGGVSLPVKQSGGEVEAEFTVTADGFFYIESEGGRRKSRDFLINALADSPPEVSAQVPEGETLDIGVDDAVNIFYEVKDDFGVSKLALESKSGGSEKLEKTIHQSQKDSALVEGSFRWGVSGVEPSADGIIEVRVVAYDNDAVSGPKMGASDWMKIRIASPQEKHSRSSAAARELLDRIIAALAGNIDERPRENQDAASLNAAAQRRVAEIRQIEDALAAALGLMREDELSDYAYFTALSNMDSRISQILRRRLDAASSSQDAPSLAALLSQEEAEFEQYALLLDSMIQGDKIRDSALRAREAAGKYRELSDLLSRLKNGASEEAKREIANKIKELQNLMARLAEGLNSLNSDIAEGFLNADAFEAIDMAGDLSEIMKLVEEGRIDEALARLSKLGSGIESMIASLEGGMGALASSSLAGDMENLGGLMSKVSSLRTSQEALKGETERLKESILKSAGKNSPSDFAAREAKKVEKLRKNLADASADALGSGSVQTSFLIDRLLGDVAELEKWLRAHELDEAIKRAKEIQEQSALLRDIDKSDSRGIRSAAALARDIRRGLEEAKASGAGAGEARRISKKQDDIRGRASELSEGDEVSSSEIQAKLEESIGFMRGAGENLGSGEISKSISNQSEAIESLRQAEYQANELMRQFALSASGRPYSVPRALGRRQSQGEGGGIDTGFVEIPSGGESEFAKKFKETVLKSLKEGSPEGYGELNRKYYERIAK